MTRVSTLRRLMLSPPMNYIDEKLKNYIAVQKAKYGTPGDQLSETLN